jgi:hypothetical protein
LFLKQTHEKKLHGVRSGDLAGQFMVPPRPIQRQQDSRFAGTKPLDLHVQLLQLQGRLICEFKFQMASLFDY